MLDLKELWVPKDRQAPKVCPVRKEIQETKEYRDRLAVQEHLEILVLRVLLVSKEPKEHLGPLGLLVIQAPVDLRDK